MAVISSTTLESLSLKLSIIVIAAAAFFYHLLRSLYRVTTHPLAGYPGPKSRGISHFPAALEGFKGREPFAILELHRRYGPVVRISPNIISFSDSQAWNAIYGPRAVDKFQKTSYFPLRSGVADILTSNGNDHSRQRAAINHAFSDKALKGQEPLIMSYIDQLMMRLQERADKPGEAVNIVQWFEYTAFDIIGDLAFSTHFDCLKKNEFHPWVAILMNFFKAVSYALNAKMFGPLLMPLLMAFAPVQDLKKGKMHVEMSAQKVQHRLTRGDDDSLNDFWTYILRSKDQQGKSAMSKEEMEVNAAVFLPAGTETVASALSGCVWYLSKYAHTLKKLREEIEGAFSSEDLITIGNTASLPYLRAVIEETLRIYPPFPGMARREPPGPDGGSVLGWHIAKDYSVGVSRLAAHRSPANFSRPDDFVPERWLARSQGAPEWAAKDAKDACQAFSLGPQNCVGKALAYAELRLIIAKLVWRFDWTLADDDFAPEKQRVFFGWEKPPLRATITSRQSRLVVLKD